MAARLNPYLNFDGTAREAMDFYHSVFGGNLVMNTFGEFGMQDSPDANKIMHAMLETERGFALMASDLPSGMEFKPGQTMSVSVSGDAAAADDLRGYWEKLSAEGSVTMPFEKQVWGDEFGMCIDRFGTPWMIDIGQG